MALRRFVYPGGNTRFGFYSFYEHMVGAEVEQKIILKGGPGVGKSSLIKKVGEYFAGLGVDIEEHGCSSDPDSLDGIVIGRQQFCLVDGTSPHIVDPVYPGAVDQIVNLGDYWNQELIKAHRREIVNLTNDISKCFARAYGRLKECALVGDELKRHFGENRVAKSLNRNVQGITADFLAGTVTDYRPLRHLFAGALTPGGMKTRLDTLVNEQTAVFAVKSSPGAGVQDLFTHTRRLMEQGGIYGEIFHNPVDPDDIDYILVPSSNALLIDVTSSLLPYKDILKGMKMKRLLDLDQLLDHEGVSARAKLIFSASQRYDQGIAEVVEILQTAKIWHDELETYYIPSMDFDAVEACRQQIVKDWQAQLAAKL